MRSFKAARRAAQRKPVEFDYVYDIEVEQEDGDTTVEERTEHFKCHGKVDTLLLSELAHNSDVDVNDPEGMKLIRDFFSQAFGVTYVERDVDGKKVEQPQDNERLAAFRRFFVLHTRYGDDDLLMEIVQGLVEEFAARPTQLPSASVPTSAETAGAPGRVVSLSQRTERPMSPEEQEQAASEAVVQGTVEQTETSPEASLG